MPGPLSFRTTSGLAPGSASNWTIDRHLDLGDAPLPEPILGDKISTLVTSALAGGDCIDDADALRTGRTACTLGCVVKAPSHLDDGTSCAVLHRWGHVRLPISTASLAASV